MRKAVKRRWVWFAGADACAIEGVRIKGRTGLVAELFMSRT